MSSRMLLFGGTFDPVHHGHLIVARAVGEALGVNQVTLVPAARSPHKSGTSASARQRLNMLHLAVEDDGCFEICELELNRRLPSYTLDTLRQLKSLHGDGVELFWVIGSDMLAALHKWHRVDEVLEIASIVTVHRPPPADPNVIFEPIEGLFSPDQIARLKKMLTPAPLIDISSTDVRRRVAEGLSIKYLVPPSVAEYISREGLYRRG